MAKFINKKCRLPDTTLMAYYRWNDSIYRRNWSTMETHVCRSVQPNGRGRRNWSQNLDSLVSIFFESFGCEKQEISIIFSFNLLFMVCQQFVSVRSQRWVKITWSVIIQWYRKWCIIWFLESILFNGWIKYIIMFLH